MSNAWPKFFGEQIQEWDSTINDRAPERSNGEAHCCQWFIRIAAESTGERFRERFAVSVS
jgi:hypothetical protein